ncbi:MAG: hypothetical protein CBARDMAM_5623 [uncultured Caballeronia sp.]|nr:MAG: hypothetical protein CBARDMAM_5623 [uncultured Caballeronia sp.]
MTVTTADDIGALTTEIMFAQPRVVDQIVYIAGDTITYLTVNSPIQSMISWT